MSSTQHFLNKQTISNKLKMAIKIANNKYVFIIVYNTLKYIFNYNIFNNLLKFS